MKGSRPLLLSCFLAFALLHSASAAHLPNAIRADITGILGNTDSTTATTASSTSHTSSSSSAAATTSPSTTATTATTASTTPSSATSTGTTASTTGTSATDTTKSTGTSAAQTSATPTSPPTQSVVTSTNAAGGTVLLTTTISGTSTSASASSSASSGADNGSSSDSSSLSTGSIIGLSVAGGIAALGIVGFFIWKFTRKRFSDFDDTEAIKWPELNTHSGDGGDSHPLPVHNTGRAGFDTGSEVSLSRAPSTTNTHGNFSTPDLGNDPYSVPPLPHLNPNQPIPYRDDPNAIGGYYDPYRGPVPGTFSEPGTATEWGPNHGEAYPMAQMGAAGSTGRASPGPSMMGRMSPGPGMAYDYRGSSPQPPIAGRGSPGPQAAYDNYGR